MLTNTTAQPAHQELTHIWGKCNENLLVEVYPQLNKPFRIYEHSANNVSLDFSSSNTFGLRHLEDPELAEGFASTAIANIYVGCYIDGTTFVIATKSIEAEPYLWHGQGKLTEMLECAKNVWLITTSDGHYYAPNWKLADPDWTSIDPINLLKTEFIAYPDNVEEGSLTE
jgi:hypothetical protein